MGFEMSKEEEDIYFFVAQMLYNSISSLGKKVTLH